MVSQQKKMGPTAQSYKNEGYINDHLDEISAARLPTKNRVLQHKTRIKTSHEYTSSTDDSNMSVDKMMTNYQKTKQIANFWKADDSVIQVSL
jgi:ABC-type iron transport system FetAB ATPase subunit